MDMDGDGDGLVLSDAVREGEEDGNGAAEGEEEDEGDPEGEDDGVGDNAASVRRVRPQSGSCWRR